MDRLAEIDKEITETEAKIQALKAERESIKRVTPDQRVAVKLHSLLCHANHTDGCSWYYETNAIGAGGHNWDAHNHADYLKKANRIVNAFGEEAAHKFIDALEAS